LTGAKPEEQTGGKRDKEASSRTSGQLASFFKKYKRTAQDVYLYVSSHLCKNSKRVYIADLGHFEEADE